MGKKRLLFIIIVLFFSLISLAKTIEETDTANNYDRIIKEMQQEDYITVSLFVASSGFEIYSAAGHAALRMECPSKKIDYCYEFDNIINIEHLLDYLNGDMQALYKRIYTHTFIERYKKSGRGIRSLKLNLTPTQKINLWQNLDYQVDSVGIMTFDFLSNNCSSMVITVLQESIKPSVIQFSNSNKYLNGTHREIFPYIFANAPWSEFCWNILMGTGFDEEYDFETRLFPIALIDLFPSAIIKDPNGHERQLCGLPPATIINPIKSKTSFFTPKFLFIALLILSLIATIIEFMCHYNLFCRIVDITLMLIETFIGIVILYMLTISNQVATSWNWLIIVFSPFPFLAWLLCRKSHNFYKVYIIFTTILLFYCISAPIIPQMQYASLPILLLAFSLRTVSRWLIDGNILINHNINIKKKSL